VYCLATLPGAGRLQALSSNEVKEAYTAMKYSERYSAYVS